MESTQSREDLNGDLFLKRLERVEVARESYTYGKVLKATGLIFTARVLGAGIGSVCEVIPAHSVSGLNRQSSKKVSAEVIGFEGSETVLMALEGGEALSPGDLVRVTERSSSILVHTGYLGRVVDPLGNPIDGKGPIIAPKGEKPVRQELWNQAPDSMSRAVIRDPFSVGVRAIDGLLTLGKGQRVGIMAGSGVGKSVLLGMFARRAASEVNVIGLIGERGREVREFVERDLGSEGLAKSVVVVGTSDQSPLMRKRGAILATAFAEYFRDVHKKDVLLMMDSVTRFCMAQREIGLSLMEPPATKGYPPSVFALLPKVLERAGVGAQGGSITGLYTVLVEGDDMSEPIADSARSILDGHIVLSRRIAQRNQYPAIDVLQSASRVMSAVVDSNHIQFSSQFKDLLAAYDQAEDLINVGAYVKGSNPRIDQAIFARDRMLKFLKQGAQETAEFSQSLGDLISISRSVESFSQSKR